MLPIKLIGISGPFKDLHSISRLAPLQHQPGTLRDIFRENDLIAVCRVLMTHSDSVLASFYSSYLYYSTIAPCKKKKNDTLKNQDWAIRQFLQ